MTTLLLLVTMEYDETQSSPEGERNALQDLLMCSERSHVHVDIVEEPDESTTNN